MRECYWHSTIYIKIVESKRYNSDNYVGKYFVAWDF